MIHINAYSALLTISLALLANSATADTYESEPNNNMASSDTLNLAGITNGQLADPDDEDWFKFSVNKRDQVWSFHVDLDVNAWDGYFTLTIYDSNNNKLANMTNKGNTIDVTTSFSELGYFYAVIGCPYSYSWYSDPYHITVDGGDQSNECDLNDNGNVDTDDRRQKAQTLRFEYQNWVASCMAGKASQGAAHTLPAMESEAKAGSLQ